MGTMISLVNVTEDCDESIRKAVYKSIDLIDFKFPKRLQNIVIKPALCYYWDVSTGETTDPRVVSAVIDYVRERGNAESEIFVVESDATAMRTTFVFKVLHYEEVTERKKVKLVNLSLDESIKMPVNGFHFSEINVPRTIKEADLFISVPKLKLHSLTGISCVLKNQFGCIPYQRKIRYHPHINEVLADLNYVMRPNLCVVDGIVVKGKSPLRLDLIMAGTDAVAVDSVAARIMGFNPRRIKHLTSAAKKGVGSIDDAILIGESLESFKRKFPRFGRIEKVVANFMDKSYQIYRKITKDSGLVGASL